MKVIVASNNKGKIKEFGEIFASLGLECISMREAGIIDSPEEDGTSFEENAMIKAHACREALEDEAGEYIVVADDSGIMCDALNGEPGIYSARAGGPGLNDYERMMNLAQRMENVPDGERGIQYYCAIACIMPDGKEFLTNGICRGEMLREPRGENGFGHDPIFYLPQYGKTFAEVPAEIKNQISHRAIALRACVTKISELEKDYADK